MTPTLTAEDWAEIYYALKTKIALIQERERRYGLVDRGYADREWITQLHRIVETIGPDGKNMVTL